MDPLESLFAARPDFHAWQDGRPANWSMSPDVLRYLGSCLEPTMRTLETGAGASSVVFAIRGTQHTCVTPDRAEAQRIEAYCEQAGIRHSITFIHDPSDHALPRSPLIPDTLDFVLIDGAHRFPMAIIDWHYAAARLSVNGVVAVDDVQLPSVRILYDFLMVEDEWELTRTIGGTAFFRHVRATTTENDWQGQMINRPHLLAQAREPRWRSLLRRVLCA